MKHKIIIISIFSFLILFFGSFAAKAQVEGTEELFDEDQIVYWFYVKVQNEKHPKTRIESYNLRLISNKVHAGNADEFDVQLWRHLSKGTKLAIGPFERYDEAESATSFYKNFSKDTLIFDDSVKKDDPAFYYLIDLYIRERSGSYGIKRIPAAIFPGTFREFAQIMQISVNQKKVAVGPFPSKQIAEESKRRYRLQ